VDSTSADTSGATVGQKLLVVVAAVGIACGLILLGLGASEGFTERRADPVLRGVRRTWLHVRTASNPGAAQALDKIDG